MVLAVLLLVPTVSSPPSEDGPMRSSEASSESCSSRPPAIAQTPLDAAPTAPAGDTRIDGTVQEVSETADRTVQHLRRTVDLPDGCDGVDLP